MSAAKRGRSYFTTSRKLLPPAFTEEVTAEHGTHGRNSHLVFEGLRCREGWHGGRLNVDRVAGTGVTPYPPLSPARLERAETLQVDLPPVCHGSIVGSTTWLSLPTQQAGAHLHVVPIHRLSHVGYRYIYQPVRYKVYCIHL